MQRGRAAPTGLLGPDADAEGLVLDLLNRQDRYVARRTCQARRSGLGARTTTLVLCEDGSEEVLPSVDLARSFPGVRTLVLRCAFKAREQCPERFIAFVARNRAALQQLQHLDLLGNVFDTSPLITAAALDSIAQLTSLNSLAAWVDCDMQPASWGALRNLSQLTSLRVRTLGQGDGHLQHIAAAAPQLQQLHHTSGSLGSRGACCLASLRSLASLHLAAYTEGSTQMAHALTALAGLTHLSLELTGGNSSRGLQQQLLQALGQLTGLSSLEVHGISHKDLRLTPLGALQQLTSLRLGGMARESQDAAVLGRLGALRALDAVFDGPAAAAAAGLERLQRVMVEVQGAHAAGPVAPIQLAVGSHLAVRGFAALRCLDTSQVHVLEVQGVRDAAAAVEAACQALRSSPQLRGLRLDSHSLARHPQVLQAVAACDQLTSLHLRVKQSRGGAAPAAADGLDALAHGCGRLRQLTLQGMQRLGADVLPALMRLPGLRLLRLLGCNPAVGQEQCQALVGRLGLQQLQVDVVVADGSPRAEWMMEQLGNAWREEVQ